MTHYRITRLATLAIATAAIAAPTAGAAAANTQASGPPRQSQDLVSPDARDAARTSSPSVTAAKVDRRSPDARDAAAGRGTWTAPDVTVVKVSEPVSSGSGLDWGDAGIGAGAVVAVLLIALGSGLAITHRRHAAQRPSRSATVA